MQRVRRSAWYSVMMVADVQQTDERMTLANLRERCVAAALLAFPLSLAGEWLVVHTHHRPLGAATFATLSLIGLTSLAIAVARAGADRASGRRARVARWISGGLGALSLLAALARLS